MFDQPFDLILLRHPVELVSGCFLGSFVRRRENLVAGRFNRVIMDRPNLGQERLEPTHLSVLIPRDGGPFPVFHEDGEGAVGLDLLKDMSGAHWSLFIWAEQNLGSGGQRGGDGK